MDHRLYFNAREWKFNPGCSTNTGERSFITDVSGKLEEAYTISRWGGAYHTEIIGPVLTLEKNTEYTFTFWLNGGENDRAEEICQLHILLDNDADNAYVYKLNRCFIKPFKRYKGWNLYVIPFRTAENTFTQMKFVASGAYTTVMHAADQEEYAGLEDVLDEFEGKRPQRHNIVMSDGWPTDLWYSTENLRRQRDKRLAQQNGLDMNEIREEIREELLNGLDIDSLREEILDGLDVDNLKAEIWDSKMGL